MNKVTENIEKEFDENILVRRYRNITRLADTPDYENCYLIDGKTVLGFEDKCLGRKATVCFQSYRTSDYKEYAKPKTFVEFENQAKEYGCILIVNNRK